MRILAKAPLTVRASLAFAQWSFRPSEAQLESNITNDTWLLIIATALGRTPYMISFHPHDNVQYGYLNPHLQEKSWGS